MRRFASSSRVWRHWSARSPAAGHCSGYCRGCDCEMRKSAARSDWRTLTFAVRRAHHWHAGRWTGSDAVARVRQKRCKQRAAGADCDGRKGCAEGWSAARQRTCRRQERSVRSGPSRWWVSGYLSSRVRRKIRLWLRRSRLFAGGCEVMIRRTRPSPLSSRSHGCEVVAVRVRKGAKARQGSCRESARMGWLPQ